MHFSSSSNIPSSQNSTTNSNNILLVPSNSSKMSFIIPNSNSSQQQPIVSSSNILSSTSNTGMTPSINLNGGINTQTITSPNISTTHGQTRLPFPSRPTLPSSSSSSTSQSQQLQIPQEEFLKILRVLQDNNMIESVETFKKEYQSLFNKPISSFSEPYFNALDGYIAYVQEQPDSSRHEFSQLVYPLFVHMYLDLVEKEHAEEAQRFFMTYVKNTLLQATVFSSHKDDLYRIKSLITKEQIAQSEYVKSFRANGRYWIKLCNASLELLDQFLIKQQKYPLLTKIVQAYFQVINSNIL